MNDSTYIVEFGFKPKSSAMLDSRSRRTIGVSEGINLNEFCGATLAFPSFDDAVNFISFNYDRFDFVRICELRELLLDSII